MHDDTETDGQHPNLMNFPHLNIADMVTLEFLRNNAPERSRITISSQN